MGAPRPQEEIAVEAPVEAAPVEAEVAPVLQALDAAAPAEAVVRTRAEGEPVATLRDFRSPVIGAVFNSELQLDNGISETRSGSEGPEGVAVLTGSYTIPLGNGEVATFNWVADELGYRVESDALPQAPEAPAHVAEQLRIAEEQRAAGITFDQRGFRIEA